ncbi:MAG: hypothetical protein ACFFDT_23910 [Candidatus Hodarchaeota archaeon]
MVKRRKKRIQSERIPVVDRYANHTLTFLLCLQRFYWKSSPISEEDIIKDLAIHSSLDSQDIKKSLEHLQGAGLVRRLKPGEVKENLEKAVYWYITEKGREIYEYYTQRPLNNIN